MTQQPKTTILTVSEPDLVAYSHGLRASYGESALRYAHQRADELKHCGDIEGAAIWQSLAGLLSAGSARPA